MPYDDTSDDTQKYGFLNDTQPTIGGKQTDLYADTDLPSLYKEPSEAIASAWHSPFDAWHQRYLGAAGALRESLGYAYGFDPSGQVGGIHELRHEDRREAGQVEALDPIVRLEKSLYDQYKNYKLDADEERNKAMLQRMFENRSSVLSSLMGQRSAAMGTPGLYHRAMAANDAIRDTYVNQALSAYKPMEAAMERQYEQQNQQLLNTLQQAQAEGESAIRSIGRSTNFG